MKLRDLRELYQAPEDDLDPEDAEEAPGDAMVHMQPRGFVGIDPGNGDAQVQVHAYACSKCKRVTMFAPPPDKVIFIPACQACDACEHCGKTHDVDYNPLRTQSALAIGFNEDEGIVSRTQRMCDACIDLNRTALDRRRIAERWGGV